jgi:hypothetical protein
MGRLKLTRPDLPKRMRFSHGAYYYVDSRNGSAKWTRLGTEIDSAVLHHSKIEAGDIDQRHVNHLRLVKPLDVLRGLVAAGEVRGPGVYFLWLEEELQYVGRSTNVKKRIYQHRTRTKGIPHDKATAIECDKFTSLIVEAVHIEAYRPVRNVILL